MHSDLSQQRRRRLTPYLVTAGLLATAQSAQGKEPEASSVPPPTVDSDGDGRMDAWDRDRDGRVDAWDTDGDGLPNVLDDDGDGKPDQPAQN